MNSRGSPEAVEHLTQPRLVYLADDLVGLASVGIQENERRHILSAKLRHETIAPTVLLHIDETELHYILVLAFKPANHGRHRLAGGSPISEELVHDR